MLLASEEQRAIGLRRIAEIRRTLFARQPNHAEEIYDTAPLHLRHTFCFHAGLTERYVWLKFHEMGYAERRKIVAALNELISLSQSLPRYISETDCLLPPKNNLSNQAGVQPAGHRSAQIHPIKYWKILWLILLIWRRSARH